MRSRELKTDVLIVGAGVGGCAAALAVAESGHNVVMTEESDWIGGQLTAQATPPDEHGWIERIGCTSTYRRFRDGVRDYYRRNYPLTDRARGARIFNPGGGWVSPLCHEPRVAKAVLEAMLAPHVSSGRLVILREHRPISGDTDGDNVQGVTILNERNGDIVWISARYFLDATELGELLPLCNVEFLTGSEAQRETGEPSAPDESRPGNAQAFSVCFAMDYLEGEDHTIERPEQYDFWRSYVPSLAPPWPGPLLSLTGLSPRTMSAVEYNFHPHGESEKAFSGLWNYRRIVARDTFEGNAFKSDVCLVNWPMIDYLLGDLTSGSKEDQRRHIYEAKQQSLSMLYWLQTEASRPDGGAGWKGLRLRADVVGTNDGLAKFPYIRESRRLRAEFTVREQDVAESSRPGATHAARFNDSVGIGYYRIDLHPTVGGDNYVDVGSLPFQIPLGALLPVRVENLVAACKNIGTTHITNGCYRLHPVEWNIGEAAGALSAFCLKNGVTPRAVYRDEGRLADFQRALIERGVELEWPREIRLEDGDPHAHAK
jgi:hypothetical protein